ncbi:hypothetical protein I6E29_09170 [Arcanobacterium haemolyticum]|nr:hypothetical protein [Arcanobacterium haemolyticum]
MAECHVKAARNEARRSSFAAMDLRVRTFVVCGDEAARLYIRRPTEKFREEVFLKIP